MNTKISINERNTNMYVNYINKKYSAAQLGKIHNVSERYIRRVMKFYKDNVTDEKLEELKKQYNIIDKKINLFAEPIPFDINSIKILNNINNINIPENTGSTNLILGGIRRGKSTLMMAIYDHFFSDDKYFISTLFTGNSQLNVYKKDKKLIISDGFTKDSINYIKKQKLIQTKTKNKYKWLNMFDDIIDQKNAEIICKLYQTYRNAKISIIQCMQYSFNVSKQNRSNLSNLFVLGAGPEEEKNLIENILNSYLINLGLNTYIEKLNFYRYITQDHGFFYIDCLNNKMTFHRLKI